MITEETKQNIRSLGSSCARYTVHSGLANSSISRIFTGCGVTSALPEGKRCDEEIEQEITQAREGTIFLISIGSNDLYLQNNGIRGIDILQEVREFYQKICLSAHRSQTEVLLIGLQPRFNTHLIRLNPQSTSWTMMKLYDQYLAAKHNSWKRDMIELTNEPIKSTYLQLGTLLDDREFFLPDGVHLNPAGNALYMAIVESKLEDELKNNWSPIDYVI